MFFFFLFFAFKSKCIIQVFQYFNTFNSCCLKHFWVSQLFPSSPVLKKIQCSYLLQSKKCFTDDRITIYSSHSLLILCTPPLCFQRRFWSFGTFVGMMMLGTVAVSAGPGGCRLWSLWIGLISVGPDWIGFWGVCRLVKCLLCFLSYFTTVLMVWQCTLSCWGRLLTSGNVTEESLNWVSLSYNNHLRRSCVPK